MVTKVPVGLIEDDDDDEDEEEGGGEEQKQQAPETETVSGLAEAAFMRKNVMLRLLLAWCNWV